MSVTTAIILALQVLQELDLLLLVKQLVNKTAKTEIELVSSKDVKAKHCKGHTNDRIDCNKTDQR